MTELDLATDYIDEIVDGLGLGDEAREKARNYAERADMEHPINRSPPVVAASAAYYAGLMSGEKRTQQEVADVADVGIVSIRKCYPEIAEAEGMELHRSSGRTEDTNETAESIRERFLEAIRRD